MRTGFIKGVFGVARLFRIIPVLAWSASAVGLGMGLSLYRAGWHEIRFSYLLLLLFIVSMFQGLASHAINDLYDWLSGTDRCSSGILSGGTRVIRDNLLQISHLKIISWISLASGIAGGLYLVWIRGLFIAALLLVGIWSTVAYTMPPVRLAYRPLAGEWLGAWPAMVSCTLGTFYVLTGVVTPYAVAGGILHATFSVSWLMQHHLSDIEADLQASPCKLTTVAYVTQKWGACYARYVVMGYFFLLAMTGIILGLFLSPAFLISAAFALICLGLAYLTNTSSIKQITSRQIAMIALSVGHALTLSAVFACRIF